MFKTHLAFGFLVGLLAISYFRPENQLLFMTLLLIGSALPDIDHPQSKIGSKVKIIGWLFEHRGFFHSLFPLILIFLFSAVYFDKPYMYSILLGYASHLVIDTTTKEGIMPLAPLSRLRLNGVLRTGHFMEFIVLVLLFVIDAFLLFTI